MGVVVYLLHSFFSLFYNYYLLERRKEGRETKAMSCRRVAGCGLRVEFKKPAENDFFLVVAYLLIFL
tara:strand:+ start:421 stop:621 length:201 start_codon:yes stop_codon:yes gene_type:complete